MDHLSGSLALARIPATPRLGRSPATDLSGVPHRRIIEARLKAAVCTWRPLMLHGSRAPGRRSGLAAAAKLTRHPPELMFIQEGAIEKVCRRKTTKWPQVVPASPSESVSGGVAVRN